MIRTQTKAVTKTRSQWHAVFNGLPKFICVTERGGKNAEHVMSIFATRDQWRANFELKRYVAEKTQLKAEEARSVHDLLAANDVETIADLGQGMAAE